TEPGVAEEARHGVLLDAELGHHPGVDDVVGGQDDAYFFIDGNHQRIVDFHEIEVGARGLAGDLLAWSAEVGEELDALGGAVDIFIAPLPLVAGDLDGQVGTGSIFHGHDGAGRGQRHADDNEKGDDRPGDFHAHVLVEFGGNRAA